MHERIHIIYVTAVIKLKLLKSNRNHHFTPKIIGISWKRNLKRNTHSVKLYTHNLYAMRQGWLRRYSGDCTHPARDRVSAVLRHRSPSSPVTQEFYSCLFFALTVSSIILFI